TTWRAHKPFRRDPRRQWSRPDAGNRARYRVVGQEAAEAAKRMAERWLAELTNRRVAQEIDWWVAKLPTDAMSRKSCQPTEQVAHEALRCQLSAPSARRDTAEKSC